MGLFINNGGHKNIYKNQEVLSDTNQTYFRKDPISEQLKEQEEINHSLHQAILELKQTTQKQNYNRKAQWNEITHQFNELKDYQDKKDSRLAQKLLDLENGNRNLQTQFNNNKQTEKEWMKQIRNLQQEKSIIRAQLNRTTIRGQRVEEKVDELISVHNQINKQVTERLDVQERTSEKAVKQLNNLRANEMKDQSNQLKELQEKHDWIEQKLVDLDVVNQEIQLQFSNHELTEQEWNNEINSLQKTKNEIVEQIKEYALTAEQTKEKVDEQINMHKQLSNQVVEQTKNQSELISRLDVYESISEKVLKQVEHFRSILFERPRLQNEKAQQPRNRTQIGRSELKSGGLSGDKSPQLGQGSATRNVGQQTPGNRKPLTRKKVYVKQQIKEPVQKKHAQPKRFSNSQIVNDLQTKENIEASRKDGKHEEK